MEIYAPTVIYVWFVLQYIIIIILIFYQFCPANGQYLPMEVYNAAWIAC